MKTQTQVLLKKTQNIPEYADSLENLQSSINRASHLVEQLLSLARLQHETLPQEDIDLSGLLRKCVNDLQQRATPKNITLNTNIPPKCMMSAHADSIAILLGNLLDNAIKYTPDHGEICITLSEEGALLCIADTGPGLSDLDKSRVFERFARADKSGQPGSGLGLSIVQWIAEAHHITITLADNQPNGLKVEMKWKKD